MQPFVFVSFLKEANLFFKKKRMYQQLTDGGSQAVSNAEHATSGPILAMLTGLYHDISLDKFMGKVSSG